MTPVTSRTFPIFLLLLWLAGVALLFGVAVYGDFDALADAARKGEITRELGRVAENASLHARKTAWSAVQGLEEFEEKIAGRAEKELERDVQWIESKLGAGDQTGEKAEPSQPATSGALVQAEFKTAKSAFNAVLSFDPAAPGHKWFTMTDPPLLVIDFPGQWEQKVRRRQVFSPGPVEKVIFGRHPEYIRMAIYYSARSGPGGPPPIITRKGQSVIVTVQAAE